MKNYLQRIYSKLILDYPVAGLVLVLTAIVFLAVHTPQFRLDASSESLSLENDQALKYYRQISAKYGSSDYLLVVYTPKADLFSEEVLRRLKELRDDLKALPRVQEVTTILDVPLINSPPVTLEELSKHTPTLEASETDRKLARQELITSPLYGDLLISKDGETTALLVSFVPSVELDEAIATRDEWRQKQQETALSDTEKQTLHQIEKDYKKLNAESQKQQLVDIAEVRQTIEKYRGEAKLHLGGVPMIVADSIEFIAQDLQVFGIAILLFLILLLSIIFREPRWVILPMLTCFGVGISVVGFLGFVDWPATIVSANFIALLLIFTLSFCVHQIVRYREFQKEHPQADQHALVGMTVRDIGVPCFYMAFTTAVGFTSLAVSDIRPVIDFGWMMTVGILFSFAITFSLFPALLMLLKPSKQNDEGDYTNRVTEFFAQTIRRHSKLVLLIFVLLMGVSLWGLNLLYVQNRFIDYYKPDTAIYQGMEVIDQKLGGTTPLEVVIDAPAEFIEFQKEERAWLEEEGFLLEEDESPAVTEGYWLGTALLKDVAAMHDYLDSLPETGKVLSLHTTSQLLQDLDEERRWDRFYLGILYKMLPTAMKEILFDPYLSQDGNQLRFSLRIHEAAGDQDRQLLLDSIRTHLMKEFKLKPEQVHLTGMMVLYNNVLQTLFRSQILTVGVVFITMFAIFWLLFRNIRIAAIAIIPNITIVALVLGVIGWLGIPLDIMTITIAAICFGMADDNTIHYVHRFMKEYAKRGDAWEAVNESHHTIGRAMYYTAITIMFGFAILAFSNFMPTIYFGLLTAFSALVALLANLAFLPLLMLIFKPLDKR